MWSVIVHNVRNGDSVPYLAIPFAPQIRRIALAPPVQARKIPSSRTGGSPGAMQTRKRRSLVDSVLIFAGAFLASTVEMVEALTIVLAAGVTRGWRAPLIGVLAGLIALAAVVGIAGPSLVNWVPLDGLRIVIGSLLLVFGLQWLRKAILRASGRKALHNEAAIYQEEVAELESEPLPEGFDWTAFTVSFKGVFLEGLEVAFIVSDLRREPRQLRADGGWRDSRADTRRWHRPCNPSTAGTRTRKSHQVRRRRDADRVRDVLGGRRHRHRMDA